MGERAKRRMGEVMSFDSAVSEAHYFVDFVNYVHSVHSAATPIRPFADTHPLSLHQRRINHIQDRYEGNQHDAMPNHFAEQARFIGGPHSCGSDGHGQTL
jgi:hypothetical protein